MAELKELWALLSDTTLKAYYRMESGALTTDSSGQGKTLTNNNTVGENASGQYFGCADFGTANTNKSLSIAETLGYVSGSPYSISCWVKIRTEISVDGTIYEIVNIGENTNDTIIQLLYQRITGNNYVTFQKYKHSIGAAGIVNYNVNLGTSNFHHIVGIYDGSNVNVYIDNVIAGAGVSAPGVGSSAPGNAMYIGANMVNGNSQMANMYIDDVCFFTKVLSAGEIGLLYNNLAATTNYLTNYRTRKRISSAVSI